MKNRSVSKVSERGRSGLTVTLGSVLGIIADRPFPSGPGNCTGDGAVCIFTQTPEIAVGFEILGQQLSAMAPPDTQRKQHEEDRSAVTCFCLYLL